MEEGQVYGFKERLFLRAPFYSFKSYALTAMAERLRDSAFRNALFLASPVLYKALEKLDFDWAVMNEKQRLTLKKYFNRMSFRPTPFGAFSSFGLLSWREGRMGVKLEEEPLLHILPAQEWQSAARDVNLADAGDFRLRANPTLFQSPAGFRYVHSSYDQAGKPGFSINELPAEPLNEEVIRICRDQAVALSRLSRIIAERTDAQESEVEAYARFLIGEQVLLTEFDGNLFDDHLPDKQSAFWNGRRAVPFNDLVSLVEMAEHLEVLNAENRIVFAGNAFYGGLERKVKAGGAEKAIQQRLQSAVEVLRKIVIPYPTPAFKKFKEMFKARFDIRRVPLLQALDPDAGIGYGDLHGRVITEGMIGNIEFPEHVEAVGQLDWTDVHRLFLRLWLQNANRQQADPVVIRADDLGALASPEGYALPPSLAVMFSCSGGNIVLDNTGGASATSLIGRFSVFSPETEMLCREIATGEGRANPDVVFAELHQLSDRHVDNINRRAPVYEAVIHVNTFAADTDQLHIPLHDLTLRMAGDELLLESLSLGKRVIPRLPTAYNFQHNPLALFQFLCDLQFQGLQANLTFDLEKLFPGLDFYPRVVADEVVLSVARWRLNESEVKELTMKPASLGRLHLFRARRGISRLVSLGLSDRQLVFDLGNDDEALFFLDCLRETRPAVVREYLLPDGSVTADGKPLAAQMVALLTRQDRVYRGAGSVHSDDEAVQREFLPGSEWLYLKIYTTPETADRLLNQVIGPFLEKFDQQVLTWFFIRYQDPDPHIRFRLRTTPERSGFLLNALRELLAGRGSLVRDLRHEVYRREIERYSPELMDNVELLFRSGSEWVLDKLRGNNDAAPRQHDLDALELIFRMALAFFPGELPGAFFSRRSESFMLEFRADKKFKISLDGKYREHRHAMQRIVRQGDVSVTGFSAEGRTSDVLKLMAQLSSSASGWTPEKRFSLLADLLHMQVNRMFSTRQREHEALIFYFLDKACLERNARLKRPSSVPASLADEHGRADA